MFDIHLKDEWGGIDEKIKSSVLGLNRHGIETTGSCEGDAAPCPWIMVKSSDLKIKEKFDRLLEEFYVTRKVSDDVRIKTFPVGSRFYIYSGKQETFATWRKSVNEAATAIAHGKDPGPGEMGVSPPEYQEEFQRFGEFLLGNRMVRRISILQER